MIFIVTALPSEAKPLIDHFKLKLTTQSPYAIYQNHQMSLVVSNIGILNTTSATTYLAAQNRTIGEDLWLNIGIAGHGSLQKGSFVIASKISMKSYQNSFYPYLPFNHPYCRSPLLSLNEPSLDYCKENLYDMEGYGFYFAALKFSTVEKIHCIKMVSDTPLASYELLTKSEVSELIFNHIPLIEDLIDRLTKYQTPKLTHPEFPLFEKHWHFTQTELYQLKHFLNTLYRYLPNSCRFDLLKVQPSKKMLLQYLQEQTRELTLL